MTCERCGTQTVTTEHSFSFNCIYDSDVRLGCVAIYPRSICLNSDGGTHQASGLARYVRSISVGCAVTDLLIDVFDNLAFYFKYASSAYDITCVRPNGNTLVMQVQMSPRI